MELARIMEMMDTVKWKCNLIELFRKDKLLRHMLYVSVYIDML